MKILTLIVVLAVLAWCAIYTVSYGVWTIRENKKGGIALFILALACIALPLFLLWIRR